MNLTNEREILNPKGYIMSNEDESKMNSGEYKPKRVPFPRGIGYNRIG